MTLAYCIVTLIICTGMIVSVRTRKLTWQASVVGGILGLIIFIAFAYTGIIIMSVFFILGSAATSFGKSKKQFSGIDEESNGRSSGQVFANAGAAGFLALFAFAFPCYANVFMLMMAAAFSSATADTLSSEMGNVFGKRFYNITTLRADKRGLNGVISFEGTAIGVAGSIIIAIADALTTDWNFGFVIIVLAGTIGNFTDSLLGATLERNGRLNNNAVNFINTAVAALIALAVQWMF